MKRASGNLRRTMDVINSPFNYTGSKSGLIDQLHKYLPTDCSICYDVFCGGGGFFVNSLDKFAKIYANDIITPLIQFYQWLKEDDWDRIISTLTLSTANIPKDNQQAYLDLRKRYNVDKQFIDFFMLVCSCTNNMMRFNKKLEFNRTWGKRNFNKNTEQRLKAYHNRIFHNDKIEFSNKSFSDVEILDNSFVYLDPPYLITEAGYNAYWSKDLERKLYDYIDELNNRKIKFMLSNVLKHKGILNPHKNRLDKYRIIELDFTYKKVARRDQEGDTVEIIVVNY